MTLGDLFRVLDNSIDVTVVSPDGSSLFRRRSGAAPKDIVSTMNVILVSSDEYVEDTLVVVVEKDKSPPI